MPYISVDGLAVYVEPDDPRLATSTIQGQQSSYTGGTQLEPDPGLATLEDLLSGFTTMFEQQLAASQPAERSEEDIRAEVEALYSYLPDEMIQMVIDGYIEHGNPERALAEARMSDVYRELFPGNVREDGSLRYTEQGYASYVERAQLALASVNINPDLFGSQIVEALANGVQIGEFEQRVDSVYERVIDAVPEIRQWYAQNYDIEMSDSAILAASLDPEIGRQILDGQLTNAEIGGEAALRGFGLDLNLADRIRQRGVDRAGAGEVFSQAAEQLPVLDVLAQRHNDPDDDFDLNEFLNASIFDDPTERRRIRRLVSQERALFTGGAPFARTRQSATGLQLR